MWFLLVSLFLVLCMLYGLVRAGRKDWEFFRIRRSGIRVTGEVIGDDPRSRGSSGGYLLVPIVRYDIDGKQTEAPVANSTDKREVGDRLDLVVDPANRWEPWVLYHNMFSQSLVIYAIGLLVAAGFTWWAITALQQAR
ncbi:hypothetical protein GCM10009765_09080 [Fodinicola feengrottensis]|uniref:DUF3592 domain-containing protein n=1 Tax=Fodinicola feengrottensis TaxID=435914 RepID=A0ABP4RXL1_9ACTN